MYQARNRKKIDIYTDASFSTENGSWGIYIPSENQLITGACPSFFKSSMEAESLAILMALEWVKQQKNTDHKDFYIRTDCMTLTKLCVNRRFKKQRTPTPEEHARWVARQKKRKPVSLTTVKLKEQIQSEVQSLKDRKIFTYLKYIKAHTLEVDNASLGNRVVDISVRRAMRDQRKDLLALSLWDRWSVKARNLFFRKSTITKWFAMSQWSHMPTHLHENKEVKNLRGQLIHQHQKTNSKAS